MRLASISRLLLIFAVTLLTTMPAKAVDLAELIKAVNAVGPEGKGHAEAIEAMKKLSAQPASEIPTMLVGMNQSNRLSVNWLRSAIESAASNGNLPIAELKSFLETETHSQYARRLAFELIVEALPEQKNAMLAEMLDDPSLEIRRDAVELEISKIKSADSKEAKISGYLAALNQAREIQQTKAIAEALSELGREVDMVKHFGMMTDWQLIGPFPNKEQSKFDEVYPPEKSIDLKASYTGDADLKVSWKSHQSEDAEGAVDLNKALSNHKGAIAYAYTEYDAVKEMEVDVRLGCINANKVWVNGQLVLSNNVYHAGMNLDQYIGKATLKKGRNTILIKVCQNEQKEPWAQRWQFQFRLTDHTGKTVAH